nr:AMP-binding protein [Candidatus Dormibacteraeota bacterium]
MRQLEGGEMALETKKQALVYRQELTPVSFLERSAVVHAGRVAVVDGDVRYTYAEWGRRARRLASALRRAGVERGDRVAFLAVNSEPLLLAHFAVPMAGAIIVAINTRLVAGEVAYIVEHSGADLIFYTPDLAPGLVDLPAAVRRIELGAAFEAFLATGDEAEAPAPVEDEYETIAVDYTSGTTGRPKGVMYHHRGAYLNALAMVLDLRLDRESRYLWTLPMFHCNGWCFTWGTVAVGAASVCLSKVDPPEVWRLLQSGEATAFCGAPTVLIMLANDPAARRLERPVRLFTAGAPPS